MPKDKDSLRAHFRRCRDSQADFESKKHSIQIQTHLEALFKGFTQGALWLAFRAYGSEVDPHSMIEASEILRRFRWAYPRMVEVTKEVTKDKGDLEFYIPAKEWTQHPLGIWEPDFKTGEKVNVEDAEGALVPGLAFDKEGGRLGSGKGFYDRALSAFKGMKVGVGYACQISQIPLPMTSQDIYMTHVVTEGGIWESWK